MSMANPPLLTSLMNSSPAAQGAQNGPPRGLPRGPTLGWSSFQRSQASVLPCIEDLPHTAFTTSGRAAIYQALLQLQLPRGSTVLVPSYHCPSMVAPVVLAQLKVAYFGLQANGLPQLDAISAQTARQAQAMLVSHYFGLPQSLAAVRQWCDLHHIRLIEDCAHSYFGQAGDRPVGAWGDYSTASLSKFFPVAEGGLLASNTHAIAPLHLNPATLTDQLKGWVDVLEASAQYQQLPGINTALRWVFTLKKGLSTPSVAQATPAPSPEHRMMNDCDMGRIRQAPGWSSMALKQVLPRPRIIRNRQINYLAYAHHLADLAGSRPLFALQPLAVAQCAPYVFPLWVDDAERVYQSLRQLQLPVFRWDRVWPDMPTLERDVSPGWRQHVLQLLCHQDLSEADIAHTCLALKNLLGQPTP